MPQKPMTPQERTAARRERVERLLRNCERQLALIGEAMHAPTLSFAQARALHRRASYWSQRAYGARRYLTALDTTPTFGGMEG